MGTCLDQAKESAENSPTTIKQRWIIHIILISITASCFLVGFILVAVGGSANVRNPILGAGEMVTGGIVLLILFAASGITWLSLMCCCGYKWVCTNH